MKFVTWNSASLLGGLHTMPHRWRRKRRELESLTMACDAVLIQESRGTEADLHFLPDSHHYFSSVPPTVLEAFSAREGGVIIGLRKSVLAKAETADLTVLSPGRVIALRLMVGGDVLIVVNAHMDPSLGVRARSQLLRSIRTYLDLHAGEPAFLGGDWNFIHMDDTRLRDGSADVRPGRAESEAFDGMFQDFGEIHQPLMTFARGSEGARTTQSRIDRWYCNTSELDLFRYFVSVAVRGSLQARAPPSDHLAVVLSISSLPCAAIETLSKMRSSLRRSAVIPIVSITFPVPNGDSLLSWRPHILLRVRCARSLGPPTKQGRGGSPKLPCVHTDTLRRARYRARSGYVHRCPTFASTGAGLVMGMPVCSTSTGRPWRRPTCSTRPTSRVPDYPRRSLPRTATGSRGITERYGAGGGVLLHRVGTMTMAHPYSSRARLLHPLSVIGAESFESVCATKMLAMFFSGMHKRRASIRNGVGQLEEPARSQTGYVTRRPAQTDCLTAFGASRPRYFTRRSTRS